MFAPEDVEGDLGLEIASTRRPTRIIFRGTLRGAGKRGSRKWGSGAGMGERREKWRRKGEALKKSRTGGTRRKEPPERAFRRRDR